MPTFRPVGCAGRLNLTLLLLGTAIAALVAAGESLHDGSELRIGSDQRLIAFVAVQALAVLLYWTGVRLVLRRRPDVRSLWIVLAAALAMRVILLASPVFLSSDLFRYIWDGRVQLHGINPYLYVPADPALAGLRDAAIFPHVNRAAYAHTIYAPAAELVFAAVAWFGQTPLVMRLAMVGFECVAVLSLLLILRRCGMPAARVLIYAWNPLAAWEFAGNGHVDALVIGLLALALLAFALNRPGWTGAALAAATLVKFLPAVAAPALWRRRDWRLPIAYLLTCAGLYGVYLGAGRHMLGFLPGYATEEGLDSGAGVWALQGVAKLAHLPASAATAYLGFVLLLLGALAAYVVAARPPQARPDTVRAASDMGRLMLVLLIAVSPHYTWYFPWLCLPAVIAPQRGAIYLGSAALLLYIDPLNDWFVWQSLVYVPAMALAAWDIRNPLSVRPPPSEDQDVRGAYEAGGPPRPQPLFRGGGR